MKTYNPKIADTECRAKLLITQSTDLSAPLEMADGLPLDLKGNSVDKQSWQKLEKAAAVIIKGLSEPVHATYLYCYRTKSFIKQ